MLQTINVGAAADDHTGDSLRAAFIKCNQTLGYSSGTHNWSNPDWKAAMMDFIDHNAPSYWLQNGAGDISYTPPGAGSPALVVGASGSVAFIDTSTLTPDGSGHLFYSGAFGAGIAAWDRYPYEAAVFYNPPGAAAYPDSKVGIYSFYTGLDSSAGASLTFGFPFASNSNGNAPGFELQCLSDPSPANTLMRFNYIERDSGGNVVAATADLLDVCGDGHVTCAGPFQSSNGVASKVSNGASPTSIDTSGGSPIVWSNPNNYNVFVFISGSGFDDLQINGTSIGIDIKTVPLQPGESVAVIWSSGAGPTMSWKPL